MIEITKQLYFNTFYELHIQKILTNGLKSPIALFFSIIKDQSCRVKFLFTSIEIAENATQEETEEKSNEH